MTYIDYCPICRGLGCGACRVGLTEYIANFTVTEEVQPEKDNSTRENEMERGSVLDEAKEIINGDRQDTYGAPEDSFKLISGYWNVYLEKIQKDMLVEYGADPRDYKLLPMLEAKDVTIMMVLFKIAREQGQGKRDNLVDAAGYIGIAGDLK